VHGRLDFISGAARRGERIWNYYVIHVYICCRILEHIMFALMVCRILGVNVFEFCRILEHIIFHNLRVRVLLYCRTPNLCVHVLFYYMVFSPLAASSSRYFGLNAW
jgi:hypothetical protein